MSHLRRLFNFLAAEDIGAGIVNVVGDRVVEQVNMLRNQCYLLARQGVITLVMPIRQNFAAVDVVETPGDDADRQ